MDMDSPPSRGGSMRQRSPSPPPAHRLDSAQHEDFFRDLRLSTIREHIFRAVIDYKVRINAPLPYVKGPVCYMCDTLK